MRQITLLIIALLVTVAIKSQTLRDQWVTCTPNGDTVLDPYFSEVETLTWSGACVNGKANGYGTLIKYINGEYESTYEGEYKNGIREGHGKFIHKDKSVKEGKFVNGQLMGQGVMNSDKGQKYVGEFINYRMHGNGTYTFSNGKKYEGYFVSDQFYRGIVIDSAGVINYYEKGEVVDKLLPPIVSDYKPEIGVELTEYFDENWQRCDKEKASYYRLITYLAPHKPSGLVKDFYITGEIQNEFYAIYIDYDDSGKYFYELASKWYYKNGKLKESCYYYNNSLNGTYSLFYENGNKKLVCNYDLGTLNGDYATWYENGGKEYIYTYKNGKMNGQFAEWYKNGKRSRVLNLKDDVIEGKSTEWYESGELEAVKQYVNGQVLDDKYIWYDENGYEAQAYQVNFSAHKEQWVSSTKDFVTNLNNDAQLELTITNNRAAAIVDSLSITTEGDFSLQMLMGKNEGNDNREYGLLFGFKDWDNYYQFSITGKGRFQIRCIADGKRRTIIDWTDSEYINRMNKANFFTIDKLNNDFIFSINGYSVATSNAQPLKGTNYGVIAEGKGKYTLKHIVLRDYKDSLNLQKKPPYDYYNVLTFDTEPFIDEHCSLSPNKP